LARWVDQLTSEEEGFLTSLFGKLKRLKPRGWSVVKGAREIVLRPADRLLGKFSVICWSRGRVYVTFFSRSANHWAGGQDFAVENEVNLREIVDWMLAQAASAEKPVNSP
jgi:hypothetical protein